MGRSGWYADYLEAQEAKEEKLKDDRHSSMLQEKASEMYDKLAWDEGRRVGMALSLLLCLMVWGCSGDKPVKTPVHSEPGSMVCEDLNTHIKTEPDPRGGLNPCPFNSVLHEVL